MLARGGRGHARDEAAGEEAGAAKGAPSPPDPTSGSAFEAAAVAAAAGSIRRRRSLRMSDSLQCTRTGEPRISAFYWSVGIIRIFMSMV